MPKLAGTDFDELPSFRPSPPPWVRRNGICRRVSRTGRVTRQLRQRSDSWIRSPVHRRVGSTLHHARVGITQPVVVRAHVAALIEIGELATGKVVKSLKVNPGDDIQLDGYEELVIIARGT